MGDLGKMGVSMRDVVQALNRLASSAPPDRIEPWMSDRAHEAGLNAVAGATAPGARAEPTVSGETAHAAGLSAVDAEMDKATTEAWRDKMKSAKASKARAGSEGRAAVEDALRPADIKALIQAMSQPPAYAPEESAALARASGLSAVEGAVRPVPPLPAGFYPLTPPGAPFGPQEVTPPGYASSGKRAAHYGRDAVERELDKEPE